jgi:Peptidase family C25
VAAHVDKLVVTHRGALRRKYGAKGYTSVRASLRELAASDAKRGVSSRVLVLDDTGALRAVGGKPVADAADAAATKDAVDAAVAAYTPNYVLLLGSPDVVARPRLRNPTPDDDPDVPSDLPYACTASHSEDPGAFAGPTTVVGRLPDVPGATEPSYLLTLLRRARAWRGRPAAEHLPVFALSAALWQASSVQSLLQLAGPGSPLHACPPEGPLWTHGQLAARLHFVNCHGDEADFRWYGDDGHAQPVALDSAALRGNVTRDAVVAAECCFGGQLYDPAVAGQPSVAATYLAEGASGVFASSTLSYGDADRTTSADLLTRFFLSAVLEGASLGRAALQARQRFVQELGELDPYDLKTLAQFDLLGDPSVHPVLAAPTPKSLTTSRRVALRAQGEALSAAVPRVGPARQSSRPIQRLAADLGVAPPAGAVARRYDLRQPAAAPVTYTVLASRPTTSRRTAVVIREEPGRPTTIRTLHSR